MANKNTPKPAPKKRGRKPKGGKLISPNDVPIKENKQTKPNIILHLQCFINELNKEPDTKNHIEAYNDSGNVLDNNNLVYSTVSQVKQEHQQQSNEQEIQPSPTEEKSIIERLNKLHKFLHHIQKNSNEDKYNVVAHETIETMEQNSACFWCTCEFNNPSFYIPKHEVNGKYEVYGCFCSPECAVAYLFDERIDHSVKLERYSLLNYLYQNVFDKYEPFQPAPNPRYLLRKYFGTMSIDEYRKLMRIGKYVMVIDKPISKVYPEVHLDNHEFEELNNVSGKRKMKLVAPKKPNQTKESKNYILQNTFGGN